MHRSRAGERVGDREAKTETQDPGSNDEPGAHPPRCCDFVAAKVCSFELWRVPSEGGEPDPGHPPLPTRKLLLLVPAFTLTTVQPTHRFRAWINLIARSGCAVFRIRPRARRLKMARNIAVGILLLVGALLIATCAKADGVFTATLLGSNEVAPTGSTATGSILVSLSGNLLSVDETFTGLVGGPAAAAHIHCCAPVGVNTGVAVPFTGFPAATSGTYMTTFDLALSSVYSSAFLTANGGTAASAESALLAGLFSGEAYANIHDATFPGGEIRGQLIQTTPTPEPSAMMLLGMGLAGLVAWRKWRGGLPTLSSE
jgi:hypothetical protein